MSAAGPVLELDALRKGFGLVEIIRGVDLSVQAGERHAISRELGWRPS